MRLVIQRVAQAHVSVDGVTTGSCTNGLFILVGISNEDDAHTVEALWDKTKHLRIFEDEHHKMNRSLWMLGAVYLRSVSLPFMPIVDMVEGRLLLRRERLRMQKSSTICFARAWRRMAWRVDVGVLVQI